MEQHQQNNENNNGGNRGQAQQPGNMEDRVRFMLQQNSVPNNSNLPSSSQPTQGFASERPQTHHHNQQHRGQNIPAAMSHDGRNSQYYSQANPAAGNYRGGPSSRGFVPPGPRGQHHLGRGHPPPAQPYIPPGRGDFRSGLGRSPMQSYYERLRVQAEYLDNLVKRVESQLGMSEEEYQAKEKFRRLLELLLQRTVKESYAATPPDVNLVCFGSVASGFGTPGSDMDLALVASAPLPAALRLFEGRLLELGVGARLLTKTRVPILKICERPTPELLGALREERAKWDNMTEEERIEFELPTRKNEQSTQNKQSDPGNQASSRTDAADAPKNQQQGSTRSFNVEDALKLAESMLKMTVNSQGNDGKSQEDQQSHQKKQWTREKPPGALDFPETGVGIQCDINEENPLGIHNTALLKCYSLCDPRVKVMVLFVKAWASRRKVNSARHGTLSSYGYVLMVLHFLVNIAQPPVCPNLQLFAYSNPQASGSHPDDKCGGFAVRFWRDETEIQRLAESGELTRNRQTIGELLRDFFRYFADPTYHEGRSNGFIWTKEVLSLRTPGGILTKEYKLWTGAKTTVQENVEVRHRYLFAIEDPFEISHNVARPVTHHGIVAIRDEFRRAWRILNQVSSGYNPEGGLLDPHISKQTAESREQRDHQSGSRSTNATAPTAP